MQHSIALEPDINFDYANLDALRRQHPAWRLLVAELVAYLQLASEQANAVMDETTMESIEWLARDGEQQLVKRVARLPRVIFVRP